MFKDESPGIDRRAAQERLQRIRLALRGALVDRARDRADPRPGTPPSKGAAPEGLRA